MRVLLDEQIDRRLKSKLDDSFDVVTVAERGWRGKENGELLRAAEAEFDVLVTMDKSIVHQQNLSAIRLSIVVLRAFSNRFKDVDPLMPETNRVLSRIRVGEVVHVGR